MTEATNPTRVVPLDEVKELGRKLTLESAAAALETLAAAVARKRLGAGCEKTLRGAEAMRECILKVAREMAQQWRAEAGQLPASPA